MYMWCVCACLGLCAHWCLCECVLYRQPPLEGMLVLLLGARWWWWCPSRLCGAGVRGVRGAERKSREKEEIWAGSRAQCLPMGGASEIQPAQLGSRQVIVGALGECGPGSAVALALESIFSRLHNGHLRVGGGAQVDPRKRPWTDALLQMFQLYLLGGSSVSKRFEFLFKKPSSGLASWP